MLPPSPSPQTCDRDECSAENADEVNRFTREQTMWGEEDEYVEDVCSPYAVEYGRMLHRTCYYLAR